MQGDSPEADPRLEKANFGPKVATGFVDPCLVFLETTLPGEVPLLLALFAYSSKEARPDGGGTRLEFSECVVFKWTGYHKGGWLPMSYSALDCILQSHGTDFLFDTRFSRIHPSNSDRDLLPPSAEKLIFTGAIKFLDEKECESLLSFIPVPFDIKSQVILAEMILERAEVEWQSIADALTLLKQMKANMDRPRRKSIVRRVLSFLFKKKESVPA
jgi:hypothetical protein